MTRASLVRLFSILVVVAVVVAMAPPALLADASVNRVGATAPLPELAQAAGADAVRLTASDSLHAAMLGASQVITASPSAACASELTRSETDWAHTVNDMPVNGSDLPAEQRPRFVYVQQSRSYRETLPLVRTDYGYEKERQNGSQLGNLTYQQERLGSGSAWAAAALRTTYTQYYPNLTYWVVNKPAQSHFYEKCYDVPGQADPCDGGVIKSATRNYYDGAASPDGIVPDKGRLTRQEQGLDSLWQDTRYSYTPDPTSGIPDTGNLLKVERMDGGVVHSSSGTFYDPRFRAYPVCTKNILGHTTRQRYYGVPGSSDAGCTTTAGSTLPVTGGFFGQLEQAIDENGQATTLHYDGLGRILTVVRPGDSAANPTVRFSYTAYSGQNAPFWIKKEQRDGVDVIARRVGMQ